MKNPFRHPVFKKIWLKLKGSNFDSLGLQIVLGLIVIAMLTVSLETRSAFSADYEEVKAEVDAGKKHEFDLPSVAPSILQPVGTLLALVGFIISLRLRKKRSFLRRSRITQLALWFVAIGVLAAWLPSDYIANAAKLDVAMIGEKPSAAAYWGKLFFVTVLIVSIPLASTFFYNASIMDRYTVTSFLTPFTFCLVGFIAIWLIFDLVDNGPDFGANDVGLTTIVRFYFVQLPQVVLFVLPVTILLSLLYSLSKMSQANELISMLGAGRSVMRVLRPLFFFGLYASLICLVFNYQWAPRSEGYKEAMLDSINSGEFKEQQKEAEKNKGKKGKKRKTADSWAKLGWLYVNETDHRTWFVGRVPYDLVYNNMNSIVIWQFDKDRRLLASHRATSAKWFFGNGIWKLNNGKTYLYGEDGVPIIQSWDALEIPGWRETPWKVLSNSLNPEFLGIPGLTTYLQTNADYESARLAPFRTNWWYRWAEPLSCIVMVLVSAPLGIVYSRRGVLGGVAASIAIFAAMYFMRGTLIALGQSGFLPAFVAAWGTNLFFAIIGGLLLFYRSRNRELPKLRNLFRKKPSYA